MLSDGDALYVEENYEGAAASYSDVRARPACPRCRQGGGRQRQRRGPARAPLHSVSAPRSIWLAQALSADGSNVRALTHRSIVYCKLARFEGAGRSNPPTPRCWTPPV